MKKAKTDIDFEEYSKDLEKQIDKCRVRRAKRKAKNE